MQRRIAVLTLVFTLVALVLPFAQTQAATGLTVPVAGKAKNGTRVTGTFTITQFVATADPTNPVGATGTLAVKLADGRTAVSQVTMPVKFPTAAASTGTTIQQLTCEILELTLGPLDLNLLGLEIHLDTVHLGIDANPAGGLLGELLCAIANLLTSGDILSILNQLLTLLNQLLGML